jgi:ammonium transporter, Amt family
MILPSYLRHPTFTRHLAPSLVLGTVAGLALAEPSLAQSVPPVPNKGDTTWMLISTVLVLLMTIPGLALFYGGLVRSKNMLSVLSQVFAIVAVVSLIWVVYGYSLAFTDGGPWNGFVGGLSKMFLAGVDPNTTVETFSRGVVIPEYVFIAFQMTFACITPALIVGAFAERIKFSALMLFVVLWVTFVYFPIAHMVWWWPGPEAAATKPAAEIVAGAGLIWGFGALDFAGGTVVHINAGIAGLVGCLMLGKRLGFGKDLMAPHSLTLTMVGAALLWVGWFGFNVGSNLEANGTAALAMINTFVATAAAAVAWLVVEWVGKGKPSLLGMVSGAVAGLVAVTPAAGFAGPMGSIVLGLIAGTICYLFCTSIKNALGYDDTLDVFGIHCIGGILGAVGTGILVNPAVGGTGIIDYAMNNGAGGIATYDLATQIMAQLKGIGVTVLWSAIGSAILFKLVDSIIGLRATQEKEREGLDLADHGERAYNY